VIIDDLNVMRIAFTPAKADAPLVIHPNAVRPGAISLEQFQLVARRYAKILQPLCLMQVQKLPPRSTFDRLKPADHAVLKKRLGIRAFERPDQTASL
jgi:hypothetical protein